MNASARALIAVSMLTVAMPAFAHDATGAAWTFDAWIVVPLLISALLFGIGAARLLRRTSVRTLQWRRIGWFALGWMSLALALVSPLHAAGERSFAAHMLEHEMLMLVAAPLIVLSRPLGFMVWALPMSVRRGSGTIERNTVVAQAWGWLTAPILATALQAIALWVWHAPWLFDLALERSGWHVAQHLAFVVTALLFWTSMLDAHRLSRRPVVIVGCLFASALVSGALGALMAFSWSPWYVAYARLGLTPFGLSPVEDQQLAGVVMWVPGGVVHAGAALAIVALLLRDGTRHMPVPSSTHDQAGRSSGVVRPS